MQVTDAGVDIVIGSHTHRVQGVGYLGDHFVAYGMGNFIFKANSPEVEAIATRVPDTEADKGVVTSPSLLDQTFCTCNCAVKAGSGEG